MLINHTTNSDSHPNHACCPIVQEILGLIKHGAAQILDKQYQQAYTSLTRALQMNKEILVLETKHEETPREDAALPSSSCLCGQVLDLAIATTWGDSCCKCHEEENYLPFEVNYADYQYYGLTSSRRMYAHSTPLVLPQCDKLLDLVGMMRMQDFQLTLSVIIIFNLALSQHLYGICQLKKGDSCNSTLLIRAYSLYGFSYTLLQQMKLETCWFLGLAIVNNKAQVLSIIGKHQDAEKLLQVILSGLCCLNQCIRNEKHEGFFILPKSFHHGLIYNTSHLILKDVATASAA